MKRLGLMALVLAVVLGSTTAQADFYVVAGGGPPLGTKITGVPYTISAPGFYYFGKNLTYGGSGNAITVNVDDVTLDLMGFSLISPGSGQYGIYMNGRANVEIRNGTLRGFYIGVHESSVNTGNKHRIINIRANNNYHGIFINGTNHLIEKCNVSNNTIFGIVLMSGLITECIASNNDLGIALSGPGNVLGNTVVDNASRNFDFGNGVATAIMADRNSAFGLTTNYYVQPGTTGIQWGINAGSP
ncbi:MAG: right-handed parallel beta-helix repeat-containing protein [Thermodesulfobacteriota bacterium]